MPITKATEAVVSLTSPTIAGTPVFSGMIQCAQGTGSLAPIRLTAGTNLVTPVSGSIEFDGTNLYITNSSNLRKTLLYSDSTLTASLLSGTIPSGVLGNSAHFIGTTSIALNRASASQTLTGVSIDGNAATATTASAVASGGAFNGSIASINGYSPSNGAIRLTPNLHLNSNPGYAVMLNWDGGTTGSTQTLRVGNGAGSDVFYVRADGYVWASNDITAYSDSRNKENIVTINAPLKRVMNMRGVFYNMKDDESKKRKTGVIAQEIQHVLPEVVLEGTDDDKTLSVAYGNMVGLLIEAIKELNMKVEALTK